MRNIDCNDQVRGWIGTPILAHVDLLNCTWWFMDFLIHIAILIKLRLPPKLSKSVGLYPQPQIQYSFSLTVRIIRNDMIWVWLDFIGYPAYPQISCFRTSFYHHFIYKKTMPFRRGASSVLGLHQRQSCGNAPCHTCKWLGKNRPGTLWLCQNSYWKWPVIVDFPIKHGDFP